MKLISRKSNICGSVRIPGSKSHTIRAVVIGALADGVSRIRKPLEASDTLAAVEACRRFGAEISEENGDWVVRGTAGHPQPAAETIDVGNSGTTLYIALGTAALADGVSLLTGDEQIRRRPAGPLLEALNALGARVESVHGNDCAPIRVCGPVTGGTIELDGSKTSQYLTSLLINCPLAAGDTDVTVRNLIEKPYVEMTLAWLREQGVSVENNGFERFSIPGGQSYRPFDRAIPGDFSSATFFMCAAAITGSDITLLGLDLNDTQGDKAVAGMLGEMGAVVEPVEGGLRIVGGPLKAARLDLNDTPDALPALAVTACFAEGETRLENVPQARLKETDRIAVMCRELRKMGADIEELPDGLVIRNSRLRGAETAGHGDHRVIMALACAGLTTEEETVIDSAEALGVTFPTFVELMNAVGADMRLE